MVCFIDKNKKEESKTQCSNSLVHNGGRAAAQPVQFRQPSEKLTYNLGTYYRRLFATYCLMSSVPFPRKLQWQHDCSVDPLNWYLYNGTCCGTLTCYRLWFKCPLIASVQRQVNLLFSLCKKTVNVRSSKRVWLTLEQDTMLCHQGIQFSHNEYLGSSSNRSGTRLQ